MPPSVQRARRLAQQVLRAHGDDLPVDVEALARQHAEVVYRELHSDISGMLVPNGDKWFIVVNEAHPHVRRRFTIAHELGHLLLHGYTQPHVDRGYKVRFRDPRSSEGSVREEIEANQFAAELLIPQHLLVPSIRQLDIEFESMADDQLAAQLRPIAELFDVSQQALTIRLSSLNMLW